jgi:hypothetical protein
VTRLEKGDGWGWGGRRPEEVEGKRENAETKEYKGTDGALKNVTLLLDCLKAELNHVPCIYPNMKNLTH